MKYLVGLTDIFMSPLTGKLRAIAQLPSLGSQDYIIIGDPQGNPIASPAFIDVKLDIVELRTLLNKIAELKFILQQANSVVPNAQALDELINGFLYNTDGVLSISTPGAGSIALPHGYVFVGDEDNLAAAQPTINFDNLPNLTNTRIWRGNGSNRPVESDSLTSVEGGLSTTIENLSNLANVVNAISNTVDALSSTVDAIETGIASVGGFAAILLLQAQVIGLFGAVGSLSSRMGTAEGHINDILNALPAIYADLGNIHSDLTSIHTQLTAIENNIDDIEDDIDSINTQITEINGDIADINTRIDNLSATFVGDVQGSGLISNPINLELMLTLDQIKKAEDTVDLNNNKIINLVSDDVEQLDALNAKFLWDLMHDNVGVVYV